MNSIKGREVTHGWKVSNWILCTSSLWCLSQSWDDNGTLCCPQEELSRSNWQIDCNEIDRAHVQPSRELTLCIVDTLILHQLQAKHVNFTRKKAHDLMQRLSTWTLLSSVTLPKGWTFMVWPLVFSSGAPLRINYRSAAPPFIRVKMHCGILNGLY